MTDAKLIALEAEFRNPKRSMVTPKTTEYALGFAEGMARCADMLAAYIASDAAAKPEGGGEFVHAWTVRDVAWHIGKAVEYIEKQWPDAPQLDREPILRNMRRWALRLSNAVAEAATPPPSSTAPEAVLREVIAAGRALGAVRRSYDGPELDKAHDRLTAALNAADEVFR